MLLSSFYTGLSGLQANATALNVVGNNLANINTAGFKRSQANFAQVMSNTIDGVSGAGNPNQVGLGTQTTEVVAKFEQGSIQTTGIKTHMAIQGEGFFQVDVAGTQAFTRSGNFAFNEEGFLTAANGGIVKGFNGTAPDGTVDTSGGIQNIKVDLGQSSQPQATTSLKFISNLSADAEVGDTYGASIEVFDSKGVSHQVSITYTKHADPDRWDYVFDMPTGTADTTAGFQPDGFLRFDALGNLSELDGTPIGTATERTIRFLNLTSNAADLTFTWDLIDESTTPFSSFVTNYGNRNNTGTLSQNGFGSGVLQDIDFDQDGTMIGFFDNGLSLELARVALATFNNKFGLKQIDGGYYFATAASGPASVDGEGTGGRGSIISSSLESSNVDIAEEFTSLIVHQRGYQSNSRIITTTDQLLQEVLNLKR